MFQFRCPQCANVLQADPAQAGQHSQCPICQALFIIPAPVDIPAPAAPVPGPNLPLPGSFPTPGAGEAPAQARWSPLAPHSGTPAPSPPAPAPRIEEPETLHIPCPQCREVLEAPVEMLDQEVLCPHCEAQFRLERRNSLEFQRRRQQELEIRERKAGKLWFNWAIFAVVLVVMFLLFLVISASRG